MNHLCYCHFHTPSTLLLLLPPVTWTVVVASEAFFVLVDVVNALRPPWMLVVLVTPKVTTCSYPQTIAQQVEGCSFVCAAVLCWERRGSPMRQRTDYVNQSSASQMSRCDQRQWKSCCGGSRKPSRDHPEHCVGCCAENSLLSLLAMVVSEACFPYKEY